MVLALFFLLVAGGAGAGFAIKGELSLWKGLFGLFALVSAGALLWLTVDRWSRWLTGLALIAALKMVPAFTSGTYWSGARAHERAPRLMFGAAIASFVLLALLSNRFGDRRPKPDEKVVLVCFVLVCALALPFKSAYVWVWTAGLAALAIIWLKGTLSSRRRGPLAQRRGTQRGPG